MNAFSLATSQIAKMKAFANLAISKPIYIWEPSVFELFHNSESSTLVGAFQNFMKPSVKPFPELPSIILLSYDLRAILMCHAQRIFLELIKIGPIHL